MDLEDKLKVPAGEMAEEAHSSHRTEVSLSIACTYFFSIWKRAYYYERSTE